MHPRIGAAENAVVDEAALLALDVGEADDVDDADDDVDDEWWKCGIGKERRSESADEMRL